MNNIIFTKNNTRIFDGYLETDIEDMVDYIIEQRHKEGYPVTRTKASYIAEWKAHNRLYRLHIKRTHTKDVDMEEPINKFIDIIWRILGI